MWARRQIINWTWYVQYEIDKGFAFIYLHDRLKNGLATHPHPETDTEYDIEESPDREALYLVDGHKWPIMNQMHVFSYPKFGEIFTCAACGRITRIEHRCNADGVMQCCDCHD